MASLLQRVIQIVDRNTQPEQPSPKPIFTVKAMLERSIVFEGIAEKKAKLETFRTQECEFRAILVATYASMAYEAERCRFKVETRDWKDGSTLQSEFERVEEALDAHTNCLEEISYLERSIEDDQGDLDDSALWE